MSTPVNLRGKIVGEPELRFAPSGKAVARFCVVTSRRIKNNDTGQWEDQDSSFHNCVAFGAFAENIIESCPKMTNVIVSGNLKQEEYTTKEGDKRKTWTVLVDELGVSCRWNKVEVSEGASSNGNSNGNKSYDSEPPF